MITAQIERFTDILPELQVLFPKHWEELALNRDKVPLDPMYEIYLARDAVDEMVVVTLRELGEIRGYFIGFINPGLHYRTCLTCIMDIFYVDPPHRGRRGGIMLFRALEAELRRRNVQRMFVGSKVHKDASRLFEALGYNKVEVYYSKWLGTD